MSEDGNPGVYNRSIKSGTWYMLSIFFQKSFGVVTFLILARLLLPSDYGIIAVVLMVNGLLSQMTTVSFGDALTQRQDDVDAYMDPLWSLELARSLSLGIAIYLAGGWLVDFFHVAPAFAPMISWSGILLVLPALANIRQIYLFKGLNFKKIFYRDAAGQLAYTLTAVGYALLIKPDAWALFLGLIAQALVVVITSYVIYPSKPVLSMAMRRLLDLVGFAKWVYGQEIFEMFLAQVDKIFVGRWLSTAELGAYAKARDLASTASNIMISMVQKVGFAAFSKLQNELPKVQAGFCKIVDMLFLTGVPMALLLALEGGAAVNVLLGPKWLVIVVPLKIFAFGNLFYAFSGMASPVLSALGRPDIVFKMNALRALLTVPLLFLGITYGGVRGLAWAIVGVWIVTLFYIIIKARPILRIPKKDFYPALYSGGVACAVVLVVDLILRAVRPEAQSSLMQFGQLALLGVIYYAAVLLVGHWNKCGPYATVMSILRELKIIGRRNA